ncbi:hypothetical protein [Streptomyces iakyrus]|uniref:aromatic-ring hydroxylase C-terminal domain-containing protein n=1 Tax=Streptomyces iakyrus TaxID=68219 RepID=UPI0033D47DA9
MRPTLKLATAKSAIAASSSCVARAAHEHIGKPRVLNPVECVPAKTRAPSRWVTSVTRSADLLRESRGLLLDRAEVRDAAAAWTGRVDTVTARTDRGDVDAWCVRWAHGSANRPEHRINSRLSFAP